MAKQAKMASQRKPLTRERILTVAIGIADKGGLEAVSMRKLSAELGFVVMSLYNHVADKDDLVAGMVNAVALEITPTADPEGWKLDLRALSISAYRMMLKHPWVPQVWTRSNGLAKKQYHEAVLRIMREQGLPEELSCRGFHAVTMHVVGFALQVLDQPFSNKREMLKLGKQALGDLPKDEFPHLREHVEFHLSGGDERNDFKYMLDLILDGLERDFGAL